MTIRRILETAFWLMLVAGLAIFLNGQPIARTLCYDPPWAETCRR